MTGVDGSRHGDRPGLDIAAVTVRFDDRIVLDHVSLSIGRGELVCLQGPSGSGKSTLLQVVAGLLVPDGGNVAFDGHDLTSLPPHRRSIGMVFQRHALFPHLDVEGNVAFGLRMAKMPAADRHRRTEELLELVGLAGCAKRTVGTLSGGEAQRVALARALAPQPSMMLFDEPLSSLDAELRDRLADDVATIMRTTATTTLYVTHDRAEAARVGDRIVDLSDLQRRH
ncbi:MAG: ABC transporter ATP-binding protein [Acidimicrobiia bacterium]